MSVGTAWRDCVLPRLPRTALEYGECVDHLMKMMPGPAKVGYVKKWRYESQAAKTSESRFVKASG